MSGSIEGQVLNQKDGQPIEAVGLEATGEGTTKQAESGAKGEFRLADLAAGNYDLVARKTGFEDGLYGPLVVLDDMPTKLVIALQPKSL